METCVEFQADCFPPYENEDQEINPGRYGKKLAEFLALGLRAKNFVCANPIPEDWGWSISIQNSEFPLRIDCANYEEYANGFVCFIEPHQPIIRKLFRKIDTTRQVGQLRVAIDQLLSDNPAIKNKRWQTYDQFNHPL